MMACLLDVTDKFPWSLSGMSSIWLRNMIKILAYMILHKLGLFSCVLLPHNSILKHSVHKDCFKVCSSEKLFMLMDKVMQQQEHIGYLGLGSLEIAMVLFLLHAVYINIF